MRWTCPDCRNEMSVADCCTQDNEWLMVCHDCGTTWTVEELTEMALDNIHDSTTSEVQQ